MRRLRKTLVGLLLTFLLIVVGNGSGVFSPIEVAAAPYKFGLIRWELANVPDKWWHKFADFLPWNSNSEEERHSELMEFFRLGEEIRAVEREINRHVARVSDLNPDAGLSPLLERLEELSRRQKSHNASAQATLESRISSALSQESLSSAFGLILPPVDLVFSDTPLVLVISPRDRIERMEIVLLGPDMMVEEMGRLEQKLLEEQNLAALVEGTGGVATYPSIVPGKRGFLKAAEIGAHEWLHQFWFFRPLGFNYDSSSQMRTLNETAADLAGDEIGRAVYEAITGEKVEILEEPSDAAEEEKAPGDFSFGEEMQQTRFRVDELLAEGRIGDAELYMETRRQLFVDNGFFIRKLNQAYFAFHGTYASSPTSVSPIHGQLERLRASVDSVGEFVRTVARFGNYEEFQAYVSGLSPVPEVASG